MRNKCSKAALVVNSHKYWYEASDYESIMALFIIIVTSFE